MTLKEYLNKLPRGGKADFAKALGVSRSFLSQLSNGDAPVSVERAVSIEQLSKKQVSRKVFFPSTWEKIWPELDK